MINGGTSTSVQSASCQLRMKIAITAPVNNMMFITNAATVPTVTMP